MKKMLTLLFICFPVYVLQANCGGQGKGQGKAQGGCQACQGCQVALPAKAEKLGLPVEQWERLWMDEIVAHDLYGQLDAQTRKPVFRNIGRSETHHREMIAGLLEAAGHPLPEAPEAGAYPDAELQKLYTQLLARGMKSENDAFKVGEEFEILDIAELEAALKTGGLSEAEIQVLTALRDASKRHLSAFQRQLNR
ncbi:MAG: DUF2202 domain-containing protein [Kiritimatiellia bacterium]